MASPKKIKATVLKAFHHSDSVVEYLFKPEGRIPSFKPGQFLHLALDPYDPALPWPESRVFSIASAPGTDTIRIVIAVKGKFTARMAAEVAEGSEAWLKLPYGNFTFGSNGTPIVLLAGGTGITPYISFLEASLLNHEAPETNLFYGVREEKYLIFGPLLETCRKSLSRFRVTVFCEGDIQEPAPFKRSGMIDMEQVLRENRDGANYYISGPPAMIETVKHTLLEKNIAPGKIHIDEW